ncbi:MAG TPA: protein kinase [Candidatus Eisenbacteria bacterium]|nr:protein kinase [Candidatus Eisenbacteria bacterium]
MPTGTPSVIGPYRIERELGRGGMGIVYLAHDTRLGRRVAIKALPDDVAADPERLARFEREARMLASLNHPNLAAVYDVLEVEGRRYLAMELVEGESLADRIARERALPLAEALDLCAQIAAGMEAAHEGGVIHRDLKPANVMITVGERVKVVDFGLARGRERDADPVRGHAVSPVLASSPTLEAPGTMPGVILGTAEYLSPEQARGKAVDRRTDIWSFGCILYECLTGKRLFAGETVSDSIAAILARPLEWSALPKETPTRVRELLERCLERDPRKRLRDIGEAQLALESARAGMATPVAGAAPVTTTAPARPQALWRRALPVVGVLGALILAWHLFGASIRRMIAGPPPRLVYVSVPLPDDWIVSGQNLSADGSTIVVKARTTTKAGGAVQDQLFVRRVDQRRIVPIPGTEGVLGSGFSPDSKWIYFSAQTGGEPRMLRVPVDGSAPALVLSRYPAGWVGGAVMRSGDVIVGLNGRQWIRVHPGSPPSAPKDLSLPGFAIPVTVLWGDRFVLLYMQYYEHGAYESGAALLDLHTGKERMILRNAGSPTILRSGHVLFTRRGTLLGQKFDFGRMEPRGQAVALMDGLRHVPESSDAYFDVSDDGTLLYRAAATETGTRRFVAVDAAGKVEEWAPMSAPFEDWFRVNPAGTRVACTLTSGEGTYQVHILDRGRSSTRLLAKEAGADLGFPFWSRSGGYVGFTRNGLTAADGVYVVDAEGARPLWRAGKAEPWSPGTMAGLGSWAPGDSQMFVTVGQGTFDLGVLRFAPGSIDVPIRALKSAGMETYPEVSPDGRYVAYSSDESGRYEVVLAPVIAGPSLGPSTQVSVGGGGLARWSRDGSRLYYGSPDGRIYSVSVSTRPTLNVGRPTPVWNMTELHVPEAAWDLLPDGRLIALQKPKEEDESKQLDLVLHFDQEVKAKIPK